MKQTIPYASLSALLYTLPFIALNYCWFLIFFFSIPFVYNQELLKKNSFLTGFYWGLCIFFIQLWGINVALFDLSKGFWLQKITIPTLIIIFQSCISGLFFYCAWYIREKITPSAFVSCMLHGLMIFMFFCYLEYVCCFATGSIEGYVLMNPLLPLFKVPFFCYIAKYCNHLLMMGLLIFLPIMITSGLIQLKQSSFFYIAAGILSYLFIATIHNIPVPKKAPPAWLSSITTLPFVFYFPHNMTHLMLTISQKLKDLIQQFPQTEIVVMPESSIYCSTLHIKELTNFFSEQSIHKKINLIAGSFAWNNNQYHNAMYWIYNGQLQNCYFKRHVMFLTEHIPLFLRNTFIEKIFFDRAPAIAPSNNQRPLLTINNTIKLVPYICSELFFNHNPDDDFGKNPILGIANDRYFSPYIADLMLLHMQKTAINWDRTIIYVSFLKQYYIDQEGMITQLQS